MKCLDNRAGSKGKRNKNKIRHRLNSQKKLSTIVKIIKKFSTEI